MQIKPFPLWRNYCHIAIWGLLLAPVFLVSTTRYWLINAFLLGIVVFVLKVRRWTRLLLLPFFVLALLQLGSYFYSGRLIDQYFWMTLWATSYRESISFFDALDWQYVICLAVYLIVSSISFFCYLKSPNLKYAWEKITFLLVALTISSQYVVSRQDSNELTKLDVLKLSYFSEVYTGYRSARGFINSFRSLSNIEKSGGPSAEAILIVLGESASKLRMGVYGYNRDTTPFIKEDSLSFTNAIAVGVNTQPNVQTLFTGLINPDLGNLDQDIFRVAKAMGYKVVYIDNNRFQNNDPIYRLASQSDKYISMNGVGQTSTENDNKIKYDDVVVNSFKNELLNRSDGKVVYVLHLVGSHPSQDLRYPESFNRFPSYYDNSILYTDYVLMQLRNVFMETYKTSPAVAMYVSDHGVRLPPGCGLGPVKDLEHVSYGADDRYFSNYAVPLFVWTNKPFIDSDRVKYDNLRNNLDVPLDHRFLLYSLSDLMGVKKINQRNVAQYSIFDAKPIFGRRINVDGKDVDEMSQKNEICTK